METCARLLEEIECWEGAALDCLGECQNSSKRRRILWAHRGVACIQKIEELAPRCLRSLESSLLSDEALKITGDVWTVFYDQLKDLQSYYRKFGSAVAGVDVQPLDSSALTALVIEDINSLAKVFSRSEELRGKVLDLTEAYQCFLNWTSYKRYREREHKLNALARIKKVKLDKEKKKQSKIPPEERSAAELTLDDIVVDESSADVQRRLAFVEADYAKYVKQYVGGLDAVPRHCKYGDDDFLNYANCLVTYLESFYRRCNPLSAVDQYFRELEKQFDELWDKKLLRNWFPPTSQLAEFYCPYTNRLFGSQQAAEGHRNSKKYRATQAKLCELKDEAGSIPANASEHQKGVLDRIQTESAAHDRELARLEFRITRLLDELSGLLESTLQNLRKKQSRSIQEINDAYKELNADEGDDNIPVESSSDGSDAFDMNTSRIKNPLNLPVGWDGKPIPYWLYRLHGLSHSYTCEICGNQKYWGKKVFENHFREWRHAFGMRCLKIPNTVHFKEITKIEDALNLYERLRNDNEGKAFLPDQEVEVEDQQGNVMTPQTYDDLRKQGLL